MVDLHESYRSALRYILSFTNYERSLRELYSPGKVNLERVRELLRRVGSPEKEPGMVHVAGTKGKGSTAAMIASVLRAAGYRTGLYTSPHLHTFRERIQIDGEMISPEYFALTLEEIKPHVESINANGEHGSLTTFEVLTALALLYYAQKGVQMEVLEVGLGGRLDATNVVHPDLCVITSLSFDHTELLGDTLAKIALEKAGIIKPGVRVVTAPQAPEALEVLGRICSERHACLVQVGEDVGWELLEASIQGQRFVVRSELGERKLEMRLLGDHQLENGAVAVAALEGLMDMGWSIPEEAFQKGFTEITWPGRLEVLEESPVLVVDGAHNGYSALRLREALLGYFRFNKAIMVFGVSSDKRIGDIVAELAPIASLVIATRSRHPRAAPPERVAALFQEAGIMVATAEGVEEALAKARAAAGPDDLICATGSLFIVGEVIGAVKRVPVEVY